MPVFLRPRATEPQMRGQSSARALERPASWVTVAMVLLFASLATRSASAETVAVPAVGGSKQLGAHTLEKILITRLEGEGFTVLSESKLKTRKQKSKTKLEIAKHAGAKFLVDASVTKSVGVAVAVARVHQVRSGKLLGAPERTVRNSRDIGKIGRELAAEIIELLREGGGSEPDASTGGAESRPSPVASAEPAADATIVAKDDPAETVEAKTELVQKTGGPPTFEVVLALGSQVATAYSVAVGSAITGLTYRLTPLLRIGGGFRFHVPSTDLSLEVDASYAPVKYALNVTPAVTPANPAGGYVSAGASLAYAIWASSAFVIEPLAGIGLDVANVEAQTDASGAARESNVVVESSALVPHFGVRLGTRSGEGFDIEADLRGRLILSYTEAPVTTGDGGKGMGFDASLIARYWLSQGISLVGTAGYEYTNITFTGTGSRTVFRGDPALADASIRAARTRITLGVTFGF